MMMISSFFFLLHTSFSLPQSSLSIAFFLFFLHTSPQSGRARCFYCSLRFVIRPCIMLKYDDLCVQPISLCDPCAPEHARAITMPRAQTKGRNEEGKE